MTYVPLICIVLPEKVWPWRVDEMVTHKYREDHYNMQVTSVRQQTQGPRTGEGCCHTRVEQTKC